MTTQQTIAQHPDYLDTLINFLFEINFLFDQVRYEHIVDMALAIAEYESQPTTANEREVIMLAYKAGVTGVWKIVQQFRNSEPYQNLAVEFEQQQPKPKPAIVATATTAKAIADKSFAKASNSKTPKQPKQAKALPMPVIADLEVMSRKELVEATKALKSNNPDISTRANAASVELKKLLSLHILGVEYVEPAKASKSKQKPAIAAVELLEGLTWDKVKMMKYRELQALGKALRSNGHEMPRLNSKTEVLRDAIASAMNFEKGVEVSYTQKPATELHLPNWNAYAESKRLEKQATELLKAAA